jgi:hypothetical protein
MSVTQMSPHVIERLVANKESQKFAMAMKELSIIIISSHRPRSCDVIKSYAYRQAIPHLRNTSV